MNSVNGTNIPLEIDDHKKKIQKGALGSQLHQSWLLHNL
jgi:hypothetical protein